MLKKHKSQQEIIEKLGIEKLNQMQVETQNAFAKNNNITLLSPTGTGKTLAFLLPVLEKVQPNVEGVQVLIMVPSRELALQIEQVVLNMGTGYKTNAIYGGRPMAKDKMDLKHSPTFLIGTPGRIAHHLRRDGFETNQIHTLVLDEFDKSLEVGFEEDMREIIMALRYLDNRILTSATSLNKIPTFVGMENTVHLNFLDQTINALKVEGVASKVKDKTDGLLKIIAHQGEAPGIIFCNFRDSVEELSTILNKHKIAHGKFYGTMEQNDRERALVKFRNGTHKIIVATDLAARGLDIPELKYIVHFQLPLKSEEFTHRNGRTARMHKDGTAYVLTQLRENLPSYIQNLKPAALAVADEIQAPEWTTLLMLGGKKDKISKGDIAGLFIKQGGLKGHELGMIELKSDSAFVAVTAKKAKAMVEALDNEKLKNKKIRLRIV